MTPFQLFQQQRAHKLRREAALRLIAKIEREILRPIPYKLICLKSEERPILLPKTDDRYTLTGVPPLLEFQERPLVECVEALGVGESRILIAPTGSGKTYFTGAVLRLCKKLYPEVFPPSQLIILITKPTIIQQTERVVLGLYKNHGVFITSYSQMVATLGQVFIRWDTRIVNGQPVLWPFWRVKPSLIIFDECHSLKNEGSQQTLIGESAAEQKIPTLFMSATPYSRPIHTRVVACALAPKIYGENNPLRLNAKNFHSWITGISAPRKPEDWCPTAMKRIQSVLEPYTLRFGKLTYKKTTIIKQVTCNFESNEERKIYTDAFDEYQEARMSFGNDPLAGFAEVLVAMLKFRQKAEILRAPHLARLAFETEQQKGVSPIIACAFQDTLKVVHGWLVKLGVPSESIGTIMGGQSANERQRNIDEFQSGRRRFMLLMFSAGGAGLSLHHHKETQRPRVVFLPPVWSSEELVQVLGRAHRINSISTTYQYILYFEGTIEVEVMKKVKGKCSALKEVTTRSEAWTSMFDGKEAATSVNKKLKDEDVDPSMLKDKGDDEEEEDGGDSDLPVDVEIE